MPVPKRAGIVAFVKQLKYLHGGIAEYLTVAARASFSASSKEATEKCTGLCTDEEITCVQEVESSKINTWIV